MEERVRVCPRICVGRIVRGPSRLFDPRSSPAVQDDFWAKRTDITLDFERTQEIFPELVLEIEPLNNDFNGL